MHWLLQLSLGWSPSVLDRQASESPKCAARLVVRAPPHVHVTPILRHLHWLPVRAKISCKTACLCFNAITFTTAAYLSDLLHLYSPSRSLRSSADSRLLKIPHYQCKTKGDRAFSSVLAYHRGQQCKPAQLSKIGHFPKSIAHDMRTIHMNLYWK